MKFTLKYHYYMSLVNLDVGASYAQRAIQDQARSNRLNVILRHPYCVLVTIKTKNQVSPAVVASNVCQALKAVARTVEEPYIINTMVIPEESNSVEIQVGEFKEIKQ